MNNYNDFAITKVTKDELYDIMQKKYEDATVFHKFAPLPLRDITR